MLHLFSPACQSTALGSTHNYLLYSPSQTEHSCQRTSTQTHGEKRNTQLQDVNLQYDGFLHQSSILLALKHHMQPLCQITERLPASTCLRPRLAGLVPDKTVTLSKISSLAGDKKLYGRINAPAPLSPALIKMLVVSGRCMAWSSVQRPKRFAENSFSPHLRNKLFS